MDPLHYIALYAAALPPTPRPPRPLPALPSLVEHHFHLIAGSGETPPLTLPQLYEAGVECGHTEARLELKRRVGDVNAQLEASRAVRDRAQGDKEQLVTDLLIAQRTIALLQLQSGPTQMHLESEVAKARHRIHEIESSKAWRATGPIRRTGQRVKVLAARARARWHALRRLPHQASLAMTILNDQGPEALVKRVAQKMHGRARFQPNVPAAFRLEDAVGPLAFTPVDAPRVSIIVPVFGNALLTFTCLKSIHAQTAAGYEIVVVDDASREPIEKALAAVSGVRFHRNEANLGFIGSCNRGAQLARGEILVFLNNDPIVTPGWLDALVHILALHPDAGLVGTKLIYPDGRLQERAASSGETVRPGISGAATTRTSLNSTICAKSTIAPARASRSHARYFSRSVVSTRVMRPRITKTPTLRSPCARRAAGCSINRIPPSFISRARRRAPISSRASNGTRASIARRSPANGRRHSPRISRTVSPPKWSVTVLRSDACS
jgi:hypothetical protein